jgi:hypothetical protein
VCARVAAEKNEGGILEKERAWPPYKWRVILCRDLSVFAEELFYAKKVQNKLSTLNIYDAPEKDGSVMSMLKFVNRRFWWPHMFV